jgi:hypothetical protein
VGEKVKDMETADDNTVTDLATCLYRFIFLGKNRIVGF